MDTKIQNLKVDYMYTQNTFSNIKCTVYTQNTLSSTMYTQNMLSNITYTLKNTLTNITCALIAGYRPQCTLKTCYRTLHVLYTQNTLMNIYMYTLNTLSNINHNLKLSASATIFLHPNKIRGRAYSAAGYLLLLTATFFLQSESAPVFIAALFIK